MKEHEFSLGWMALTCLLKYSSAHVRQDNWSGAQKRSWLALELKFETQQPWAFLKRKHKYRKRKASTEFLGTPKMNEGVEENESTKRSLINRIQQNYEIGGLRKETEQIRDSPN